MNDEVLHPGRRSIRLAGYDYSSAGLYFITICTHEKRCILGRVVSARIELSSVGCAVRESWVSIPLHFAWTRLHEFVVMPNHVHGIVEICAKPGRSIAAPLQGLPVARVQAGSLGAIMRSFKAFVTKQVRRQLGWSGAVWQPNYFERVLRDGQEFSDATRYIVENPLKWKWDRENPSRHPNRAEHS